MRSLSLLLSMLALVSCADAAVRIEPVVYGADDRQEPYQHGSAAHRDVALSSIAMQIDESWLDETDPDDVRVTYTRTLGEAQTLCVGERFADQIEPGTCSGTLIDDRHVLTAGHCVADPGDCGGSSVWLFGFALTAPDTFRTLTADDVYRCERVWAYRDDEGGDHAVVELDRAVTGHVPATISELAGSAPLGAALTLIGHPNGLPMKIAANATVVSVAPPFLNADVDAFSGNSGSGVFDGSAHLLGILNAGADDYVASGDCNVVNVTDVATSDGERLTYARVALDAFCAEPGVTSSVCSAPVDAGLEIDAGLEVDAGLEGADAGILPRDAGLTDGGTAPSSAGCSAGHARPTPILMLLVMGLLLLRRR